MEKILPVRVSLETANADIMKLIQIIKPEWPEHEIEIKALSGGFSCIMNKCFLKSNPEDALTVRARGTILQNFPHVKDSLEIPVLRAVEKLGLFPKIHAVFENGFCYQFIVGEPAWHVLEPPVMSKETLGLIAQAMAVIHSVKVEGVVYTRTNCFDHLITIIEELYPENPPPNFPDKKFLSTEAKRIEKKVQSMNLPIVLCHGDPHPGNVIVHPEKDSVTFVDWELTQVGPQPKDIGHTLQLMYLASMGPEELKADFPKNYERIFITAYLKKWFELQGKKPEDVSEKDIIKLHSQVQVFQLLTTLFLLCILGAQNTVMQDYMNQVKEKFDKPPTVDPMAFVTLLIEDYKMRCDAVLGDMVQ